MPTIAIRPLTWIKINLQARKEFDELELRRLGESLKAKQLQPVVCLPDGTLICGERRYRASMLVGLESLEVKILDEQLTPSQIKVYQLTENLQRMDLSAPEKWQACLELKRLNSWSNKELAEHLHLDPSSITRILSPSDCIAEVQEAFLAGKCGISDCYAIAKFPEAEQEAVLAKKLAGATRDELESAGRRNRNAQGNNVKLARVRAPLPSGIEVVVTGKEVGLNDVIDSLAELLKDARKASDSNLDVKTWSAVLKDKARR